MTAASGGFGEINSLPLTFNCLHLPRFTPSHVGEGRFDEGDVGLGLGQEALSYLNPGPGRCAMIREKKKGKQSERRTCASRQQCSVTTRAQVLDVLVLAGVWSEGGGWSPLMRSVCQRSMTGGGGWAPRNKRSDWTITRMKGTDSCSYGTLQV